jgi:DNA-binding IclR family transcriptional regulator
LPRPSPSVSRVVTLLNLLGDRPADFLTLSEIARELDLNKATAHGILTALTDAGYIVRHPEDKGYSLGPGIVRVGRAAYRRGYEVAVLARHEMESLADAVGGQSAIIAVHADQVSTIALAGVPTAGSSALHLGLRAPLLPPFGLAYIAWAPEAEVEDWLGGEPLSDEEKSRYRRLLADIRERGFVLVTDDEERQRLVEAIGVLVHETLSHEIRETLTQLAAELARERSDVPEIRPERRYRLRTITAPIFDADGRTSQGLAISGLPEISGEQIRDYAYALCAAAGRISKRLKTEAPLLAEAVPV